MTVTGLNCSGIEVPSGVVAVPLTLKLVLPGAIASKRIDASSPEPEAPTASLTRVMTMSTRPAAGSIRGVNEVATPPWRMKLPSCTVLARTADPLKVIVIVAVDARDTPLIEIGTGYGPPPTRNSVPEGVTITCAAPAAAAGAVGAGGSGTGGISVAGRSRGGTVPGSVGVGVAGVSAGGFGGTAPGVGIASGPGGIAGRLN